MPARIEIVCPSPPGSRSGNRVTARRWAKIIRSFGIQTRITTAYSGRVVDCLVAMHARRSAPAVRAFRAKFPTRPLILGLTGTDLYKDLPGSAAARRSVALADRLIVLQPVARLALPRSARAKTHVIYQSVTVEKKSVAPNQATFDVCVIGHLRHVKDPLRTALAVRSLPDASRIRVLQLGGAIEPRWTERAQAEQRRNPRYRWLGERSHVTTLRRLAASRLMVLSSRMEGGANVIGEAAVLGVPILASRIDGNVGLLGAKHPGFFPLGDTKTLRALLLRAEAEPSFLRRLTHASKRIAGLFSRVRERRSWGALLRELHLT